MISYLSRSIADLYIKRNIIKPGEKEVYKCGLELILNDLVTFSLIIVLSAIVWKIQYAFEYLIVFCTVRLYTGGFHARKAYICRLSMIATFVLTIVLSGILKNSSMTAVIIILITSFLAMSPIIPVKHPNKELTEELVRKGRRNGLILYIVYSICSVIIFTYLPRDGMMIALTLGAVSALVIAGKFLNERRKTNEEDDK